MKCCEMHCQLLLFSTVPSLLDKKTLCCAHKRVWGWYLRKCAQHFQSNSNTPLTLPLSSLFCTWRWLGSLKLNWDVKVIMERKKKNLNLKKASIGRWNYLPINCLYPTTPVPLVWPVRRKGCIETHLLDSCQLHSRWDTRCSSSP